MRHKNSYDIIRFIAAGMVVLSHSFALTGHKEPYIGNVHIGAFGVWIFFILSGYLISASWHQYPRFNIFFAKRALRIFPGLAVTILLTILVCGLFFTSFSLISFFTNQSTFNYLSNILLFNTQYALPGVFENNIYPNAVNGSLWTLAYEFTMYIAVALLGVYGLLNRKRVSIFWALLIFAYLIITITGRNIFNLNIFYLQINILSTLAMLFFAGVIFQHYEKKIKLNFWLGLVSFGLFFGLATIFPKFSGLFAGTFLTYAIFAIGSRKELSWFGKIGDFSYGIYIYSFFIQQMIANITHTSNPIKMFALSMAISVVIASLSWHLVEKKALLIKSKINLKRYPLDQEKIAW